MFRAGILSIATATFLLLAGCSKPDNPLREPAQSGAVAAPAEKFTPASVFPPGPGRDNVVSSCGSCHSLLCGVKGQRTAERWDSIKLSHRDKLSGVSSSDLDKMFAYL
ncbi:MAG TPA: hypothetical protein VHP35_07625, partial [Terriglobia bacterium]|nr:hypothetical protein [Terriglobia bacterium]